MKEAVIIFDDFEENEEYLNNLEKLKQQIPNIKFTLFTIPAKTSSSFIQKLKKYEWIELCIHGYYHTQYEEVDISALHLLTAEGYKPIYKPPYWLISDKMLSMLNSYKIKVVLHAFDTRDGIKHNWDLSEKEFGYRQSYNGNTLQFQPTTDDILITTGHIHNKESCYNNFSISCANIINNNHKIKKYSLLSEVL